MSKLLYFLLTFAESGLSVFGIRDTYEQPAYTVVRSVTGDIEIRRYAPRMAVETAVSGSQDGEAFGRLFRYITGANRAKQTVSMTAPVEETSKLIAMTVPVEVASGAQVMRFFLPAAVARAGAPEPTDPNVHLVTLPEETVAVIRYSGIPTETARQTHTATLRAALVRLGKTPDGAPSFMGYDPPFTLPMLRRNEVAIPIKP